jgi:hypothetical protein
MIVFGQHGVEKIVKSNLKDDLPENVATFYRSLRKEKTLSTFIERKLWLNYN